MSSGFEHPSPVLSIDIYWETVFERDVPAQFHKPPYSKTATPSPAGPQIYRWVLSDSSGSINAVYIGQSREMKERLSGYCNGIPSNEKDQLNRIRGEFEKIEAAEGAVRLEILRFARFSVNGVVFSEELLSYAPARYILENLAICQARSEGLTLLNRDCEHGGSMLNLFNAEVQPCLA